MINEHPIFVYKFSSNTCTYIRFFFFEKETERVATGRRGWTYTTYLGFYSFLLRVLALDRKEGMKRRGFDIWSSFDGKNVSVPGIWHLLFLPLREEERKEKVVIFEYWTGLLFEGAPPRIPSPKLASYNFHRLEIILVSKNNEALDSVQKFSSFGVSDLESC